MKQFYSIYRNKGANERRTAGFGYELANYEAIKATTQIRIGGMR